MEEREGEETKEEVWGKRSGDAKWGTPSRPGPLRGPGFNALRATLSRSGVCFTSCPPPGLSPARGQWISILFGPRSAPYSQGRRRPDARQTDREFFGETSEGRGAARATRRLSDPAPWPRARDFFPLAQFPTLPPSPPP